MQPDPEIPLEVVEASPLTPRVSGYRLVSCGGGALPPWEAGAHLSVRLPSGRLGCYSLCGDPGSRDEYRIAVQREDQGSGGSLELARSFVPGFKLRAQRPRNGFPLAPAAKRHVLLAAGIGITPIVAMIHELRRRGADYRLHVFSRSPEETPFREVVAEEIALGRATLHHGASDPARGPSLARLIGQAEAGTHLYACGPQRFLEAYRAATASWPSGQVHLESFAPEPVETGGDRAFEVEIASTGQTLQVPAGQTLHAVLAAHGHRIDSSCRQGICGACMVGYLEGEPDHRDEALTEEERAEFLTVCCSRARSARLVLDL